MINPTFHNINSAVLYKIQQTYNPYWSKQSLRPMTGKIPETLTKEDTKKKKKRAILRRFETRGWSLVF
jgi:hypothetical protein